MRQTMLVCDRCGFQDTEKGPSDWDSLTRIRTHDGRTSNNPIDLCNRCSELFDIFMSGEGQHKQLTPANEK